jgi:DNA invertase Pin-like site-specific DNA recombinase
VSIISASYIRVSTESRKFCTQIAKIKKYISKIGIAKWRGYERRRFGSARFLTYN